jgi:hypothetical protein
MIDWYWTIGIDRQGAYEVSPVWLKNLYMRRDLLLAIESGCRQQKASLGLWGPSQSGKSTLVSQSVDQGADEQGRGGCLDWGRPVLFSSRQAVPDDVVVFNPHNLGADASGCVSRFVLRETVLYPDFPVEIRLLAPAQIMHAISAGYLSECQRGENWTVDRVEEQLEKLGNRAAGRIDRQAFEALYEVVDVLDLLVEARDERFTALNAGGKWASLANRLIQCSPLLADKRTVHEFAAQVLWDGQPALTRLFERLLKTRKQLPKADLYCSMEVAATLVNIESYRIFLENQTSGSMPPGVRRVQSVIHELSWDTRSRDGRGQDALIGAGLPQKLLDREQDFGLLQGLVRELVIPLRFPSSQSGEFVQLMKKAELVDFPGVPWRDKNVGERQLDLGTLKNADDTCLLTEVLKRGKVNSLVNGYSRTLGLDSFMILARVGNFVPKVEQLHRGLVAWWKFFDPDYDVYNPRGSSPPLPLFFNLTFFAFIVNKFSQGLVRGGTYNPLEQMVKQLEPFVDPNVCTMLATTYPHFVPEGNIVAPDLALKAIDSILADATFGSRCNNEITKQSLREMATCPDGGGSFVFKILAETISMGKRLRLLASRRRKTLLDVQGLIEEQAPSEGNEQCQRDYNAIKSAIEAALNKKGQFSGLKDPASWVSYRLRKLVEVDPEDLAPLPDNMQDLARCKNYVQEQVRRWLEGKASFTGLNELGCEPALRSRLLGYLADRVQIAEVARWIKSELPANRSREDCRELRRVLAIKLSNYMTRVANGPSVHPSLDGKDGVIEKIRAWAKYEDNEDDESNGAHVQIKNSPHYSAVIVPTARLFLEISQGNQANRPQQPGDREASDLLTVVRNCVSACAAVS